jgi:hypothetical protein
VAGASREKATSTAATRLNISIARVNELIRAAEAARLLGPIGKLSYSCIRLLRQLIHRPGKEEKKARVKNLMQPSAWEEWKIRPQYVLAGPSLVARAVAEQWTEKQLHIGLIQLLGKKPKLPTTPALYGKDEKVLTTGKVAKMLKVAPRTVSKWCDNNRLVHYRVPYTKDRRILVRDLVSFLTTNSAPVPNELIDLELVSYGLDIEMGTTFPTAFEFGACVARHIVKLAMIGDTNGMHDALTAVQFCLDHQVSRVILVVSEGNERPKLTHPCLTIAHLPCDLEAFCAIA